MNHFKYLSMQFSSIFFGRLDALCLKVEKHVYPQVISIDAIMDLWTVNTPFITLVNFDANVNLTSCHSNKIPVIIQIISSIAHLF